MKALIISDSHKLFSSIERIIENEEGINLIIHAGDMHEDVEKIIEKYPNIPCEYVLGNNEFYVRDVPNDRVFMFSGKKIFLTHGHRYGVKGGVFRVYTKALECGADVCVFGHTHEKFCEKEGDVWIVNPGTTWQSYAILNIENGEIGIELKTS
ncbi:MAG: metallophosphoesterase [Oscillospiraceae bacterium]